MGLPLTSPIREGTPLWHPSAATIAGANVTAFLAWLRAERGLAFPGYPELWQWSVDRVEEFWECLWHFYGVRATRPYRRVLSSHRMPGARWFEGAELNYAEHVFRDRPPEAPALLFESELVPLTAVSWRALEARVGAVAGWLREAGVAPGDRVVSTLPNIPEALVAFLATASVGAVWSSCSPDFGTRSVVDRFAQIEPKVLFAVDGYGYGGKRLDRRAEAEELRRALPSLAATVLVGYLDPEAILPGATPWAEVVGRERPLTFTPVPFEHPLWIVYSSGTTGLPKALVHSQGGVLLELLKFLGLHLDLHPGDRFFWFSTTGWIMWNVVGGGLLHGATAVLYDGNPGHPDLDRLWDLATRTGTTFFGVGAAYLMACRQAGLAPGQGHDLSRVRGIGSTGSPLPPEGFAWVYEAVKPDVWLASVSGGTDVASGFLGSCPTLPVCAGELQCRCLGVKAEALDEAGRPLVDAVGELVIGEPMPSMPLYLWNDPEGARYRESYFETYPGLWRHGDWIRLTPRGSAVVLGRSDSTLKRQGVRMGTSEFYRAVEGLAEVRESLIVGFDRPDGSYFMPLFVALQDGAALDDALVARIRDRIRQALSPRHLPDAMYAVDGVPRTLNGKKLEVPVKKLLMGFPLEQAVNPDSMANPQALEAFLRLARELGERPPG